MKFDKITIETKDLINSYIRKTRYLTSDYALPVILTWYDLREPEISEYNNALYIRAFLYGKRIYFPPLTNGSFKEAVDILVDYTKASGEELEIILAIKEQVDQLDQDRFELTTNRDYAEYVYLSEDLINLTGKRYHAKRNHINKFKSVYSYDFRSFEREDLGGVLELLASWTEDKGNIETDEIRMVNYFLNNIDALDLFADVILVDDKIIGTSIGECSNPDMGIVMYEKCDFKYDGVCAAFNQMVSEKHFKNIKYINRQEDIGIEGLRKSKMSYHPIMLIYRWTIRRKG